MRRRRRLARLEQVLFLCKNKSARARARALVCLAHLMVGGGAVVGT